MKNADKTFYRCFAKKLCKKGECLEKGGVRNMMIYDIADIPWNPNQYSNLFE